MIKENWIRGIGSVRCSGQIIVITLGMKITIPASTTALEKFVDDLAQSRRKQFRFHRLAAREKEPVGVGSLTGLTSQVRREVRTSSRFRTIRLRVLRRDSKPRRQHKS